MNKVVPKGIGDGKVPLVFCCGGGKLASSFVTCAQNGFTLCTRNTLKIQDVPVGKCGLF